MALLHTVKNVDGLYMFMCPGCDIYHQIHTVTAGHNGARWSFNGDMAKPTFTPSLLVRYPWGENREKRVCHSFIRNGVWEFLSDCTHDLAGQKVPMIDMDD